MTTRMQNAAAKADAFLVAPHASPAERGIAYAAGVGGAAGALSLALAADTGASVLALTVITMLGFDLFGGAVANATNAARRWWHRPGRGPWHQVGFVGAHIHPFLLAALADGFSWIDATTTYATVLLGAVVVASSPSHLRRPVAFGVSAGVITVVVSLLEVAPHLAWFAPILTVKLLLAHLLADHG